MLIPNLGLVLTNDQRAIAQREALAWKVGEMVARASLFAMLTRNEKKPRLVVAGLSESDR